MFTAKTQEKIYCGLDIGSQKIKAGLMAARPDGSEELLGIYEQKTYGFSDGSVIDLGEFSECIHTCLSRLSRNSGFKIKDIHLGIDGNLVTFRKAETAIPLIDRGSKIISSRDVKKLNKHARLLGIKVEEELLHDLPQVYTVDDVNQAMNPLGLYGRKLGVENLFILTNVNRFRNIIQAVNQAGYDVARFYFSAFASSGVSLNEIQKEKGCVLIDIGSKVTSILIFHGGILKSAETMAFGGDVLTQHIADGLRLPFDLSEEIKKSYATAMPIADNEREEILVKREQGYVPVIRGDITRSIQAVIDTFVFELSENLHASPYRSVLNQGVVVAGGGALLTGLIERIEQAAHMPTKLAHVHVSAKKNLSNDAVFTSVVGLAYYASQQCRSQNTRADQHAKWSLRVMNRVKEIYQEYF